MTIKASIPCNSMQIPLTPEESEKRLARAYGWFLDRDTLFEHQDEGFGDMGSPGFEEPSYEDML